MTVETYSHPVNQLLTFGDCREIKEDTNYIEKFGFTPEHIPELIRMAVDEELNWGDSEGLEIWGPIHAWRSLGQLRAEAAIEPLISIFDALEEIEWTSSEMPIVFGKIGPAAIPSLAAYLANPDPNRYHLSVAASCLRGIGTEHPDSRDECVKILTEKLEKFQENDPTFNGFLLVDLVKLKAVESAPVIESAFAADCIDHSIIGDWYEVHFQLGLGPRKPPENIRKAKAHEEMMKLLKNQGEAQPSKGFSSSIKKTPKKGQKKKKGK